MKQENVLRGIPNQSRDINKRKTISHGCDGQARYKERDQTEITCQDDNQLNVATSGERSDVCSGAHSE